MQLSYNFCFIYYPQLGEKLQLENEVPSMQRLSSLVWICTTTKSGSKVVIIDANNPGDILHMFTVCQAHLLCVASVPGQCFSRNIIVSFCQAEVKCFSFGAGATDSDYSIVKTVVEDTCSAKEEDILNGEYESDTEKSCETEKDLVIGKISFVSCATGSEEPPATSSEPNIESDDSPKQFGK